MLEKKKLGEQSKQSTSASRTFPIMPSKQTEEILDITIISDSKSSIAEETPTTADIDPDFTVTSEIKNSNGNETEQNRRRYRKTTQRLQSLRWLVVVQS